MPETYRRARADLRHAREALPRHAGHRVHHRGAASSGCCRRAPASAPPRRRCASPSSSRSEGLIDAGGGGAAHRSGGARSAPAPDHRSEGRAQGPGAPACRPRRARRRARSCSTPTRPRPPRRPGRKVILVRIETRPEDIHGMHAAAGILTTRGGMTSHAAVVARGMGRPCVCGAGSLRIDYAGADHDGRRAHAHARATSSPSTAPRARCSRAR